MMMDTEINRKNCFLCRDSQSCPPPYDLSCSVASFVALRFHNIATLDRPTPLPLVAVCAIR